MTVALISFERWRSQWKEAQTKLLSANWFDKSFSLVPVIRTHICKLEKEGVRVHFQENFPNNMFNVTMLCGVNESLQRLNKTAKWIDSVIIVTNWKGFELMQFSLEEWDKFFSFYTKELGNDSKQFIVRNSAFYYYKKYIEQNGKESVTGASEDSYDSRS